MKGEPTNIYVSASAADDYGYDNSTIIKTIKGNRETHGNSYWARLPVTEARKIREFSGRKIPKGKFHTFGLKISAYK
jgi:hypothetical protein